MVIAPRDPAPLDSSCETPHQTTQNSCRRSEPHTPSGSVRPQLRLCGPIHDTQITVMHNEISCHVVEPVNGDTLTQDWDKDNTTGSKGSSGTRPFGHCNITTWCLNECMTVFRGRQPRRNSLLLCEMRLLVSTFCSHFYLLVSLFISHSRASMMLRSFMTMLALKAS